MNTKSSKASKPPSSKPCRTCKKVKSLTEYYIAKSNKDGYNNECKSCRKAYVQEQAKTAKGRAVRKARLAKYYKENQVSLRMKRYGLTAEDYERMLVEQGGVCAICRQPERAKIKGKVKALSVDHNHTTGAVRRLLCLGCNVKLGWLENNLETILEYLEIR